MIIAVNRFKAYTFRAPLVIVYLIAVVSIICWAAILYWVNFYLTDNSKPFAEQAWVGEDWHLLMKSVFAIFIGPFIETFISQIIPIELL